MTQPARATYTVDNLFATSFIPAITDVLSVAAGQELKRGALLDASGNLCGKDSEVYAVLADDITTTDAAVEAAVYLTGEFNENALSVADGVAVADLKKSARKVAIFIKPCM